MTKEPDFIRVTVSRQETKEPFFQEVKVVHPKGNKTLWGDYNKHLKTDWWKPVKLNQPHHEWD